MPTNHIVLKGGTVIDGNGGAPVEKAALVIKGKRIEAVGGMDTVSIPPGARIIDTTGKTILPGLIDSHLHFWGLKNSDAFRWTLEPQEIKCIRSVMDLWKMLDSGFTAVRDTANANSHHLKRAIEEGSIVGPRLMHCGMMISHTGGHGDTIFSLPIDIMKKGSDVRIADGPNECRKAVREQLRKEATCIKISTTGGTFEDSELMDRGGPLAFSYSHQFTKEELQAMVDEAHNFGVKVSAHAVYLDGIKHALRAGVDIIEHGATLDEEAIEMMLKQGTYYVPTRYIYCKIEDEVLATANEAACKRIQKSMAFPRNSFKKAWRAGVKIGCGTDCVSDPVKFPVGENALELVYQVRDGRPAMDVLVSATKVNSEILGLQKKIGTLETGKLADLIVVNGNPLENMEILLDRANILYVYKGGSKMPRLDSSLQLKRWPTNTRD